MNCKQGDIAYVFKSVAGNYGRVVTCLKLHPAGTDNYAEDIGSLWETEGLFNTILDDGTVEQTKFVPDANLRPLRGDLSNNEVDTETPIIKETEKC